MRLRQVRKHRNEPTRVDGLRFDSKREAARYAELKLLERRGMISDLLPHPRFRLEFKAELLTVYVADFRYVDLRRNRVVVEDVKPAFRSDAARKAYQRLPAYRLWLLKTRLLKLLEGLDVDVV